MRDLRGAILRQLSRPLIALFCKQECIFVIGVE
jgi:hypothetical protein